MSKLISRVNEVMSTSSHYSECHSTDPATTFDLDQLYLVQVLKKPTIFNAWQYLRPKTRQLSLLVSKPSAHPSSGFRKL